MSTNHERRITALEESIEPVWDPETLAMVDRIAAADGLSRAELVNGVETAFQAIGYPHTPERIADYYVRQGLSPDEVRAALDRRLEDDGLTAATENDG